jgi:HlyD family secretion protein
MLTVRRPCRAGPSSVAADQLELLPRGTDPVPGMPAEVFIETGERTVLSYLMKPLADQVMHTDLKS